MTRISVTGAGYVGLITATCFAERGFTVTLTTHGTERAEKIAKGEPPIYEPGLEELLKKVVKQGNFACTTDNHRAILDSDITFITSGTPSRESGEIDLTFIEQVAKEIGFALREKSSYHLIVVKSTVIPGTTMGTVRKTLEEHSYKVAGKDFGLCMNPEFLKEGSAIWDTYHTDRIVVGGIDERSTAMLEEVFRHFYGQKCPPILKTNPSTAEAIKYASNAILATKISLINEIANICELTPSVDVNTVAEGAGLDRRIGPHFLSAGAGFGGSCFHKDLKALISYAKSLSYEPTILQGVLQVNEDQATHIVNLAEKALGSLIGKRIAILGLAFKPGTDDMREAPSIRIINTLLERKAEVTAYDPKAMENAKSILGKRIHYADSARDALREADCSILVTEWEEFKKLKSHEFLEVMRNPILVDGRRLYDSEGYRKSLKYIGIGLGKA